MEPDVAPTTYGRASSCPDPREHASGLISLESVREELRNCATGCIREEFERFEHRVRIIMVEELRELKGAAAPFHSSKALPNPEQQQLHPSSGANSQGANFYMPHPRLYISQGDAAPSKRHRPRNSLSNPSSFVSALPRMLRGGNKSPTNSRRCHPYEREPISSDAGVGEAGPNGQPRRAHPQFFPPLAADRQVSPAPNDAPETLQLSRNSPAPDSPRRIPGSIEQRLQQKQLQQRQAQPQPQQQPPQQAQQLQPQQLQPLQLQPLQLQLSPQPQLSPQSQLQLQAQQQPPPQRHSTQRVSASEQWLAVLDRNRPRSQFPSTLARSVSMRSRVGDVIYSWQFEHFFFFFVIANAVLMGIESDYSTRTLEYATPLVFELAEMCFCGAFSLEVALRIYVLGLRFFDGPDWYWNITDLMLVCLEAGLLIISAIWRWSVPSVNLLRLVRLVRLLRIVRAVHVLTELGQVRWVICSFTTCFKPVCGAMLILGLTSYVLSIYLIEVVMAYRAHADPGDISVEKLERYFGSLPICMLSLWQAISGGVDWAEMCDPLIRHVSPFAGFLLALYVAFALLALMNTVTGLFTDSAVRIAREDKESHILRRLKSAFAAMDSDGNGRVGWVEFERSLQTSELQELFHLIGLDASEAECMFKLIDINDTGIIGVEDFLSGCIRLRGKAKALDLLVLTKETRRQLSVCFDQMQEVRAQLAVLDRRTFEWKASPHCAYPDRRSSSF